MGNFNTASMQAVNASWENRGYFGRGNVEEILDSITGKIALVCGSACGVFRQFEEIYTGNEIVFAANDVGLFLPHVDHLVSLHSDKLVHWAAIRRNEASRPVGNTNLKTHTHGDRRAGIDYDWSGIGPVVMSLSGSFAMQIAYLMGAERIILLGCPGDNTPRFWETKILSTAYSEEGILSQLTREMKRLPEFKTKVRSASGFTRSLFGAP